MHTKETSPLNLIQIIAERVTKVNTQSLDLSFNELLDMQKAKELDINPEYQRLFRWSEGQRSRFIESLLLEMPIPAIYVIEEAEGRYSLIDGLQRISSYLHFRGELNAPHLDPPVKIGDCLTLSDCDIVTELNGNTFSDLGTTLQIRLKRAFIRVEVIRRESDPRFKYYMFKRLNTGGDSLSSQQVRNCTIRLLSPTFNDFIQELAENADFKTCISYLTENQRLEAYDQELVLRFFALKNNLQGFKHEVGDFLTEYMEAVSDPKSPITFVYEDERVVFEKTFRLLAKSLGNLSFGRSNTKGTKVTASFGIYQYEAFTIGVSHFLDKFDVKDRKSMENLRRLLEGIKTDTSFIKITTGGGKNSPGSLKQRINFVRKRLESFQ